MQPPVESDHLKYYHDDDRYKNQSHSNPLNKLADWHLIRGHLKCFLIEAFSLDGVRLAGNSSNERRREHPCRNSEQPYAVLPFRRWPFPQSGHTICSRDFIGGLRFALGLVSARSDLPASSFAPEGAVCGTFIFFIELSLRTLLTIPEINSLSSSINSEAL